MTVLENGRPLFCFTSDEILLILLYSAALSHQKFHFASLISHFDSDCVYSRKICVFFVKTVRCDCYIIEACFVSINLNSK